MPSAGIFAPRGNNAAHAKREQLPNVEGLDASGDVIGKKGTSWGTLHNAKTPLSVTFEAPAATLPLVLTEEIKRSQWPFVLTLRA